MSPLVERWKRTKYTAAEDNCIHQIIESLASIPKIAKCQLFRVKDISGDKMLSKMQNWLMVSMLVGIYANNGFAADEKADNEERKYPFSVKFIDEDGKPIEGVKAGVTAYTGSEGSTLTTVDATGWRYWQGTTSNSDGIADFPDGQKETDHLCLVARQTDRKLCAIWKIDSAKLDPEKTPGILEIAMRLECRVSGKLACNDLSKRNRDIGWTNVYLNFGGNRAFGYSSNDQTFHFFVPPGEYELNPYGANLHQIDTQFSIKVGQRELDLGIIELPATRLALLVGEPAPKLEGIECWKNGPAVELENLKGKCVLVEFWGYWCGPCVYQMPELFKLYDKYHEEGLEIVSIHVDLGEDEDEPVDTVEKLDERLKNTRKDLWQGRDVPYPVGLVTGKRTSYSTSIETRKARSEMSAQYGVTSYPTLVLIDRQGNVVKRFAPHRPEDITLLEMLLRD
jgi:thiol-disulfide isomerase/thioredoxin